MNYGHDMQFQNKYYVQNSAFDWHIDTSKPLINTYLLFVLNCFSCLRFIYIWLNGASRNIAIAIVVILFGSIHSCG